MPLNRDVTDAKALVAYKLASVFKPHNLRIHAILDDMGRGYQANDEMAVFKATRRLRERLVCEWEYDDYHDAYDTDCNNAFYFDDGDVDANNFEYCPFCGGRIDAL